MMHYPHFISAVEELLIRDQFAGIPGLGGIMLKSVNSNVNHYTFELKPTHSQLVFNAQLDQNDGQLTHLLSLKSNITYKEALLIIDEMVADVKSKLTQKKYATFYPFGNFFLNDQGSIFFVGRQQYNLYLENYGLLPLKWEKAKSKINSKTTHIPTKASAASVVFNVTEDIEEAQVVSVSEETISLKQEVHRSNHWFNIAAGFVLISISALTLAISTMTWVGVYRNPSQYASMDGLFSRLETSTEKNSVNNETMSEENQSSDMMYINGKLVRLAPATNKVSETDESRATNENGLAEMELNLLNSKVFQEYIFKQKGQIFLVGGTYITENAADIERKQWIQSGVPAFVFKPANSDFYRIVLGRFQSKKEVEEYSLNFKVIPGATLSMNRWNLK